MTTGARESRDSIRRHSKSFSLASRLLPGPTRDRAVAVYAWCRRADDAIDLTSPDERPVILERLRAELGNVYRGAPSTEPIMEVFRRTVVECGIPEEYPAELLAGMEMDVREETYETLPDLLEYCHRVAGVVGLMMCHVMGVHDDRALKNAAHLGMAMQLTNICRDVLEDWERGRLYLPTRLLAEHGAAGLRDHLGRPLPQDATDSVARAVRALLGEADRFYSSGDAGVPALSWRNALAIRTARRVYSAIGSRVRDKDCDPFAGRAYVPLSQKLLLVTGAIAETTLELPSRARLGRKPTRPGRVLRFPDDILPIQVAA